VSQNYLIQIKSEHITTLSQATNHHRTTSSHVVQSAKSACAMQSMFRLPWSTEPSNEKALADKSLYPQQKPRNYTKPRVDIPVANINSHTKRKRIDSVDTATPKTGAQLVKKAKNEGDGAVQPALEPTKGPDGLSSAALSSIKVAALGHNTVKSKEISQENIVAAVAPAQSFIKAEVTDIGKSDSSIVNSLQEQPAAVAKTASLLIAQLPPHASLSSRSATTNDSSSMSKSQVDVDKLRAVIEAQLNLEILHKHNELRLIEQELSKCQIGLEQLRRCEVIPYPGSQSPSQDVSCGTGPALASPAGYTSPLSPAPWGVSDSPYARHYAKWLLSDPHFDPTLQGAMGTPLTARGVRATRGSGAEPLLPAPPPRNSRVSTGSARAQASGDATTPSTGRDPMVLKRQADGEWVRLRCNHCHRSNFNNVQGFLNHCRIAHHQEYKSHEAAAISCGEIVQIDETQFPAEPAPAPRERVERPSVVTNTFDQGLVSPLISNAPAHSPYDRVLTFTPNMTPLASPATPGPSTAGFGSKPSLAPHLSALMQRRGLSTSGLDDAIRDNKKRVDLSAYDDSDSEGDDQKSKRQRAKKPKGSRNPSSGQHTLPKPSSLGASRPQSQKGHRAASQPFVQDPVRHQSPALQVPSRLILSFSSGRVTPASPSDVDVDMELSPGTADFNPGLVSDHDDDDDDVDEAGSTNGSHTEPEMMEVDIEDASDVERESRKSMGVMDSDGQVCRREGLSEGSGGMC
jgi:ADA HAT complex component 1